MDLIVGSKEVPTARLVTTLRAIESFVLFFDNWSDIARDLSTPSDKIKKLRQDWTLEKISLSDLVHEMLEVWVGRMGSEATLNQFIRVLENNRMKSCAETIENEFFNKSQSSPKLYKRVPPPVKEFLEDGNPQLLCIVSTFDLEITCKKIMQNIKFCLVCEFRAFLDLASADKLSSKFRYIVSGCDLGEMQRIFENLLHLSASHKIIIVTQASSHIPEEFRKYPFWHNLTRLCTDTIEWGDLSLVHQYELREKLRKQYGLTREMDSPEEMLNGQILIDLINNNPLKLFKQTLPPIPDYYINRKVITRNVISKSIFENNFPDIIVLTGIPRYKLSRSVRKDEITDNSTTQLHRNKLTVRFMILDRPHHFTEICGRTAQPVHYLNCEGDKLRWIKSRGKLDLIQKYIHDHCQEELEEMEFHFSLKSNNQSVCISDSPGMGKSVLLARIGGWLTQECPDKVVIFLTVNDLLRRLTSHDETVVNSREQRIRTVIAEFIAECQFGKMVFYSMMESQGGTVMVELLLDGFDEVGSTDVRFAHDVIRTISLKLPQARLWLTTRPHYLIEMEKNLSPIGFQIAPFKKEDQIHFLVRFWSRNGENEMDEQQLINFANTCLQTLGEKLNSRDKDIAGIPLQCLMIGEIFEDEAVAASTQYSLAGEGGCDNHVQQNIKINSIIDLYALMLERKLEKFQNIHSNPDAPIPKDILLHMHLRYSIELIFPETFGMLDIVTESPRITLNEIVKVGIVEVSRTSYRFIHRTFAEYFISWFISDMIQRGEELKNEQVKFIFRQVLRCKNVLQGGKSLTSSTHASSGSRGGIATCYEFVHPVICYFLNLFLTNYAIPPGDALKTKFCYSTSTAQKITLATAYHDCIHLFRLINDLSSLQSNSVGIFTKNFVPVLIRHSRLEFIDLALTSLEARTNVTLEVATMALGEAMRRGEFSIVEMFLKQRHFFDTLQESNWNRCQLLNYCAKNSARRREIQQTVDIMHLILEINPLLMQGIGDDEHAGTGSAILEANVHIVLIIELIRLGIDTLATDNKGNSILHLSPEREHLSAENYHSILTTIPEYQRGILVNLRGEGGCTPLATLLRYSSGCKVETLELFRDAGANFNEPDAQGNPILALAIAFGRGPHIIQKLIELGSDVHWKGHLSGTLLHVAAQCGNAESLDVLIKHGLDMNGMDEEGNTPLHLALLANLSFPIMKSLLVHNANPNLLNKRGETPLQFGLLNNPDLDFETFKWLKIKTKDITWTSPTATCALRLVLAQNEEDMDPMQFNSLVRECLDNGADLQANDRLGNSALHTASRNGNCRVVQFLIPKCITLNGMNNRGQTPLHLAALVVESETSLKILKCLMSNGADVYSRDGNGDTFLHTLLREGAMRSPSQFHELVQLLTSNGYINIFNVVGGKNGDTSLQLAVGRLELEEQTLSLLCSKGTNFKVTNLQGETVFYYAISGGRSKSFLASLVKFGADFGQLDKANHNLLHISANFSNCEALECCLGWDINVNDVDVGGNTPLHNAASKASHNLLEMTNLLMKHGADVKLRNKGGATPLAICLARDDVDEIVRNELVELVSAQEIHE